MADRYQDHRTKAVAVELSKAVDKELKIPRKGRNVGRGPHASIPQVYTPGAIGWTATECAIDEDPVSKTALLTLTDAAVALSRRAVVVDGKTVTIDMTSGVITEKPAKYL